MDAEQEHRGRTGGDVDDLVFDSAVRLLEQRDRRVGDVESSILAGEIANDTDLEREAVTESLTRLGGRRLHINVTANGQEIEVLGRVEENRPGRTED
jgi:hypothetical protein